MAFRNGVGHRARRAIDRALSGPSRLLIEDHAEVVVVGTGAGGATAARVLAGRGLDVVMLEEGPRLRTADRPRAVAQALAKTMREAGAQTTSSAVPIVVLQGRCVGGSTAINSGIIWHMPEDVREDWTRRFGLQRTVDAEGLERAYSQIERELEIEETSDSILGGNSAMMARGARALGLPGKRIVRNAGRCEGRGECLQGCPGEKRQSMDVSYVPKAMSDGARLHTHTRVDRVEIRGGRAVGVSGQVLDPDTRRPIGRFIVHAERVVMAAGVVHTPVILRKSGLGGAVGNHFQAHPGAAMVGKFPEPVRMSFGATQGYEVPMRERGFKLESLSLPPEMLASRLPGVGADWQERLGRLDHYAQWCAQVRMQAHGRIRPGLPGLGPDIRFRPTTSDIGKLQEALTTVARMMFAAGAEEVYPGVHGVPDVLRSTRDVDAMAERRWTKTDVHLVASHLFGTARAGVDSRTSVVGDDLQSHEVSGLYVMDASVFPTNLGVNPQHSIMAVVHVAAERLAEQRVSSRAA